jgi:nucleolar protein 4
MKDLKSGKNKGFAFVAFANDEMALDALRSLNNNPEAFTKDQRPIVEFSLENKKVLNAREKRLEKSKEKNPTVISAAAADGTGAVAGGAKKGKLARKKAKRDAKKLALKQNEGETK